MISVIRALEMSNKSSPHSFHWLAQFLVFGTRRLIVLESTTHTTNHPHTPART